MKWTITIVIIASLIGIFFVFRNGSDGLEEINQVISGEQEASAETSTTNTQTESTLTNTNNESATNNVDTINTNSNKTETMTTEENNEEVTTNDMPVAATGGNATAVFDTSMGSFSLELFTQDMPITTSNFISLVERDFYNGILFHRVIPGFMVQAGDPNTIGADPATIDRWGTGGADPILDEHVVFDNYSNVRGTISMANAGPNSGSSQFFINVADNQNLDFDKQPLQSKHPVFGRVISGMEVVDAISTANRGARDVPVTPIVINSVTIVRN